MNEVDFVFDESKKLVIKKTSILQIKILQNTIYCRKINTAAQYSSVQTQKYYFRKSKSKKIYHEFTMTMAADSNTRGSVWINTFLEGEKQREHISAKLD